MTGDEHNARVTHKNLVGSGSISGEMTTIGESSDHCGKPNCDREAEKTYDGPNGNSVRVCGMHYYKLVTRGTSETSPLGLGTDITPGNVKITDGSSMSGFEREAEIDFEPELDTERTR